METEPPHGTSVVTLTLTPDEVDALLAVLLRVPETESVSNEKIDQLLFRVLRKLPLAQSEKDSTRSSLDEINSE